MTNLTIRNMLAVGMGVLLSSLSVSGYAEIYRWVDENGKTHISDKAPEESVESLQTLEKKDIKINAVEESESARSGRENYLNTISAEQKQADTDALKKQKEDDKKDKICKKMKMALYDLNSGHRLYNVDDSGEREYMSDEVRDKKNAEITNEYNKKCNPY